MTAPVPPRSGIRRSRSGAVLGRAGVARSAGLDPLLLRIAVVAVTLLTGGAGPLAYLVIGCSSRARSRRPPTSRRWARPHRPGSTCGSCWSAAGKDLRSLAGSCAGRSPALRRDRPRKHDGAVPVPPAAPVVGAPDPGAATGETRLIRRSVPSVAPLTSGCRRRRRDRPGRSPARPRGAGRGAARRGRQRDAGPCRQRRRGRRRHPRPHATDSRADSGARAGSRPAPGRGWSPPRIRRPRLPQAGADRPGSGDQRPLRAAGSRHDPGNGNVMDVRPEATGKMTRNSDLVTAVEDSLAAP